MNRILHALAIAASALFAGCAAESPSTAVLPVIEGWIDSDGYPIVIFTSSLVPDGGGGSLLDKMIRWGRVSVSDGERTVVLTGGLSDSYFPPYRYYSFDIKGEPGRVYTLVADYEDFHVEASCLMPSPTEIGRVELSPISGNDTLRAAEVWFTAPPDCPAYYCVCVRDVESRGRQLPAMMGKAVAVEPGKEMSIPLFNPKNMLDTVPFVPQLSVGQKLQVSLCRVTREVYEFWKEYDNAVMFGGSQFVSSSVSLEGNVTGGYGVWSARGVSSVFLDVE